MTATVPRSDTTGTPVPDWAAAARGRPGLERALDRLDEAVESATTLGLDTSTAERVGGEARERLGFPADVYVLALVGGTGVGKSSLLNALAGSPVSRASVRRPTTDRPVAWVPGDGRADLDGLLDWLGVGEVFEHAEPALSGVAILDLPDMDSVEQAHRERVERLLPRVDAVAWVTDPEKYHDAVLHDDFLRTWVVRLDSQAIVLNKADRIGRDGIEQLRRDLEHDLARMPAGPAGRHAPVLVTSATGGPDGLAELRRWLERGVEAKRIVRARLATSIHAAIDELATAAGVDPGVAAAPFLDPALRRRATDGVSREVLRAIDLPGLERQAIAATRARARSRGTGPLGLITSAVYRLSGREARVADPGGYLVRWRDRGPLGPAVEELRRSLVEPVRRAPPAVRPALAASVAPDRLLAGLANAIDRAVARNDRTVPSSRVWPLLGALQTISTAAVALSVVWIVIWILARPPVDSVQVPVVGSLPAPLVALVLSLLAGYVIARLLGLHAGWLGRRWAARLRHDVQDAVTRQVEEHALVGLDRLESAGRALWTVARASLDDARRP